MRDGDSFFSSVISLQNELNLEKFQGRLDKVKTEFDELSSLQLQVRFKLSINASIFLRLVTKTITNSFFLKNKI